MIHATRRPINEPDTVARTMLTGMNHLRMELNFKHHELFINILVDFLSLKF